MDTATVLRSILCLGFAAGFTAACSDNGSSGGRYPMPDGSTADGANPGTGDAGGSDADWQACQLALPLGGVSGKRMENTCLFLGLPYGKPPVDALRFAAPEPAGAWEGVRDATMFGPSCMQRASVLGGSSAMSEDCLSLNVYAPASARAAKLPVMVFLHGGGYTLGGSSTYDGRLLSEKGPVVVVTLNYRLGALGFFAHPDLDQDRAGAPSGSDGIRDQQLALRWVKDNISAFRGDPNDVTVFGESAGSFSATILLVSPLSRDLANRFIFESGVAVGGGFGTTSRDAEVTLSTAMASELCSGAPDVIACLRAKPAQELVDWTGGATGVFGAPWTPVIDSSAGAVLPDAPENLIDGGNYNRAATLMAGTNENEWGLFIQPALGGTPLTTVEQFNASVEQQFGDGAAEVEAQYPVASDAEANDVFIRLVTDQVFRCPTRSFARLTTAHGSKLYLYSFDEGTAYHGDELAYVFGMPSFAGTSPVPALVAIVQSYWTRFADSGDPNGTPGLPVWPPYDSAGDRHAVLQQSPYPASGLAKSDCDFWDRFGQ